MVILNNDDLDLQILLQTPEQLQFHLDGSLGCCRVAEMPKYSSPEGKSHEGDMRSAGTVTS